jgi:lipopolysaccharide export system permease protein
MVLSPDQTDLFLTLEDGIVLEVPTARRGGFQQAEFIEQFLPIRGISNIFERGSAGGGRGDREMSTNQLADSARAEEAASLEYLEEIKTESLQAVKRALGWQAAGDTLVPPSNAYQAAGRPFLPGDRLPPDEITRGVVFSTQLNNQQSKYLRFNAIEKRVEIHKKYAIAFACIVFVLLGAPLAVRFPRGGVGMVTTASVVIFAIFWACLIGGETLADDGYVSPALAMWLPNILLTPVGIVMVARISSQVATARGGGWDDLIFTFSAAIQRPFSKLARRKRGS